MVTLLTRNFFEGLGHPWAEMALTVVAILAGGYVGWEREQHEKPAGFRTLILVCLGAAVFTMASSAFHDGDGRIAAQIVTGVGFLGGGVIMHGRNNLVSGTTTAATIWVVAAVGVVAGAGFGFSALGLSVVIRGLLSVAGFYESLLARQRNATRVEIGFHPKRGLTRVRLEKLLVDYGIKKDGQEWKSESDESAHLIVKTKLRLVHFRELLSDIAGIEGVTSIQESELPPSETPRALR